MHNDIIKYNNKYPTQFILTCHATNDTMMIDKCLWQLNTVDTQLSILNKYDSIHGIHHSLISLDYFPIDYLRTVTYLICQLHEFDKIDSLSAFHSLKSIHLTGSWTKTTTLLQTLPDSTKDTLHEIGIHITVLSQVPAMKDVELDHPPLYTFNKFTQLKKLSITFASIPRLEVRTHLSLAFRYKQSVLDDILCHIMMCISSLESSLTHLKVNLCGSGYSIYEPSCLRPPKEMAWYTHNAHMSFYKYTGKPFHECIPSSLTHCELVPIQVLYTNTSITFYPRMSVHKRVDPTNLIVNDCGLDVTDCEGTSSVIFDGVKKEMDVKFVHEDTFPIKTVEMLLTHLQTHLPHLSMIKVLIDEDLSRYYYQSSIQQRRCEHGHLIKPPLSLIAPTHQDMYWKTLIKNHEKYVPNQDLSHSHCSLF